VFRVVGFLRALTVRVSKTIWSDFAILCAMQGCLNNRVRDAVIFSFKAK
jgi:hypothetical protein